MAEKKSTSLGADATLLTFSKVATSGIAMVMTMLLSRFRTLEEYGTYSQILMVVNLVTSILMLGLPKSLNYFLAKTDAKEEKQKFLSENAQVFLMNGFPIVSPYLIILQILVFVS